MQGACRWGRGTTSEGSGVQGTREMRRGGVGEFRAMDRWGNRQRKNFAASPISKILAFLAHSHHSFLLYASFLLHLITITRLSVNRQDYDLRADAARECLSFRGDCLTAFSQTQRCRRQPVINLEGERMATCSRLILTHSLTRVQFATKIGSFAACVLMIRKLVKFDFN